MSKLITVALLVGGLIAGAAGGVSAQQGGIGDPLTLAASGVMIPFLLLNNAGGAATIQVASPVGDEPGLHMLFYNATCQRVGPSHGLPLTTNDHGFVQVSTFVGFIDGIAAIGDQNQSGNGLQPLKNPIHVREYLFRASDGLSRVIEPIIGNTAEFPSITHWWSTLRTGATFFAPNQDGSIGVFTDAYVICPRSTLIGLPGSAFGTDPGGIGDASFTSTGFPQINPRLPSGPGSLFVRVYGGEDNEQLQIDDTTTCDCVTRFEHISVLNPFYLVLSLFPTGGSFTELVSNPPSGAVNTPNPRTSFVGYTGSFTSGNALNQFWGRMSTGSQLSLDGLLTSER